MTRAPTPHPHESVLATLAIFPPELRGAALEDKPFRDKLDLSVDSVIQLDEIKVDFQRSALFGQIRALLSGTVSEGEIASKSDQIWKMSLHASTRRVRITSGDRTYLLPDFTCLHPDAAGRLAWYDAEVKRHGIDDEGLQAWRRVLAERQLDDEEVDGLLKQFRLTPSPRRRDHREIVEEKAGPH